MEFLEACKKLIEIDSTPSNGTGEASEFTKSLSESLGFQTLLVEEMQKGTREANVVCFPGAPEKSVHLLLQTHLDTYDPGSFALWNQTGQNPFHATIHGSTMYGLGVADTKLDFLCKLYAAQAFIGKDPKRSFALAGTYGEEYNMNGALKLVRHSIKTERILVSEPTDFALVTAGKGLANIEITIAFTEEEMRAKAEHDLSEGQSAQCKIFKGVPAHSSQPLKGVNAIEKTLEYLEQLPDQLLLMEMDGGTNYNSIPVQSLVEFDLVPVVGPTINQKIVKIYQKIKGLKGEFQKIQDSDFEPAMTTLNIGMVRTYSDHLKIMGCVRWPPAVEETIYMSWMDALKSFCATQDAVFRVRDFKKPFSVASDSEFVKDCLASIHQIHGTARVATQPVTNEANVFHKLGIETLVFGPGLREGNSQTPQESISIDNLHKATKIYEKIIEKICFS